MAIPQGFSHKEEHLPANSICKLQKSLYGLKQASRQWYAKFSSALLEEGFHQLTLDHFLFIKIKGALFIALLVYVDDIILASNNEEAMIFLKDSLNKRFKLKDLRDLRYFLGL
ncbi:hypothetical protein LWI28_015869 [Acer negundo]|uniref:Reverse transcriptase Ty1/copia-type domain-containing protein n=1 Tax=Acer negundo TaxID=4023 RepID=A0AAD5IEJ6_ACENE|nr:hypothetical protein LWI28_015869 [Acer negundo]